VCVSPISNSAAPFSAKKCHFNGDTYQCPISEWALPAVSEARGMPTEALSRLAVRHIVHFPDSSLVPYVMSRFSGCGDKRDKRYNG
jgi:hypothetical protein